MSDRQLMYDYLNQNGTQVQSLGELVSGSVAGIIKSPDDNVGNPRQITLVEVPDNAWVHSEEIVFFGTSYSVTLDEIGKVQHEGAFPSINLFTLDGNAVYGRRLFLMTQDDLVAKVKKGIGQAVEQERAMTRR